MEKRRYSRTSVNVDIKFCCHNKTYRGRISDISEKGMFISTNEMYFPFESELTLYVSYMRKTVTLSAYFRRIVISPDFYTGLGVVIQKPPPEYMGFLDDLGAVCKY